MKRIAIIGACGYIGKHLVKYLRDNYNIDPYTYDIFGASLSNYKQVDLTDKNSVNNIDLNVDYIFDFAGLTGTYVGFEKYELYNSINELGLLNLLDAIKSSPYRPKIIYPSTRLVYKGVDKPLKEDDETTEE